jgi:hypothetical protein
LTGEKHLPAVIRLTIVLLLVAACVAAPSPKIMTWEEYGSISHPYPYILRLGSAKGQLLYFGSRHVYDPAHAQVAEIQKLWTEFAPTMALNEGGDPPVAETIEEAVGQFGEAGLVRYLAARDKVPVMSLEPARLEEVATLLPHYPREQIKLFYVLRQVPQYRQATLPVPLEEKIQHDLGGIAALYDLPGAPRTLAELQELCDLFLPDVPRWNDVPQSYFGPVRETTRFTNDISRRLSDLRDEHMVELLTREVKRGARVFAVVGGSHVVMQEPALRGRIP